MGEFTKHQAALICEAHEITTMLDDEEELELLSDNNPELLAAYMALHAYAYGDST